MRNLSLLLSVLFIQPFNAAKVQAQPALQNALLWEITGNGITKPSYLYGTIHMICAKDFLISEQLKKRFSASNKIYLEIDMDDPSMNMKMLQLSLLKDKKLSDFFSQSDYNKLNTFFRDSVGMPLTFFSTMKPFVLYSMITLKTLPCEKQESYEMTFVKMAKEQGKEVLGLETVEDQIKVFDDMPDSTQANMLMSYINNFDDQKKDFAKMIGFYKTQHLDSLYQQIASSPDIAGEEDALLYNRNENWIPIIEKAIKDQPTFFAVGAGHLAGDRGVINLLRKKGYTVQPVK
ncbi:MAG: TraB/GumN family protein [Agriterribacter sp.]